ncbi:MAG: LysR family transcriptional regulator substrate-binding protein [Verrucomicrobia subdivision 3 bacterium]|nr:LysR family transcriptional regulator substrate-binding protein [Limisphaerales bacterium]
MKEEQTFRIGSCATAIKQFVIPALANFDGARFALEVIADDEIERRLHDLTLDFGVVLRETLSRPLQSKVFAEAKLFLWVPKKLCKSERLAHQALKEHSLPLVLPGPELQLCQLTAPGGCAPHIQCTSFLEAQAALKQSAWACLLPDFLTPEGNPGRFLRLSMPEMNVRFRLAWNPRMTRLNPVTIRRRDLLLLSLIRTRKSKSAAS